MKILVIGGTGLIGRPVVRELLKAGNEVGVGGRSPDNILAVFNKQVTPVGLSITDPQTLKGKFAGWDCLHLSLPSGPRFEDSFKNEAGGTANIVAEALSAGIQRISYLSGATNLSADHSFPPARAKFQAESSIKSSGIPYTIWRASWFMDTLPKLARGGIVGVLGKGNSAPHWIAGHDFGKMVASSLQSVDTLNKTLYAFGPSPVSLNEAARIYRDICHPGAPIFHLPIPLISFLASIAHLHEMWFGAQMLRFLEVEPEFGDAAESNRIVGPATTTIEEFCHRLGNEI